MVLWYTQYVDTLILEVLWYTQYTYIIGTLMYIKTLWHVNYRCFSLEFIKPEMTRDFSIKLVFFSQQKIMYFLG